MPNVLGFVQKIIAHDATRLRNTEIICTYLLNPLTVGVGSYELSATQFQEILATIKILIELIEELRLESDQKSPTNITLGYFLYSLN